MQNNSNAQEWIDYFAAGKTFDTTYNLPGLRSNNLKDAAALGAADIGFVASLGITQVKMLSYNAYFGTNPSPNPVISISQHGLHTPSLPLIKWEDMVGVVISDLSIIQSKATNGSIIPPTGIGKGFIGMRADKTGFDIIVRNANVLRSTLQYCISPDLTLPQQTTKSGKDWSVYQIILDPAIGPEQTIQFIYVMYAMLAHHNIPVHQFGGTTGAFGAMNLEKSYLEQN